jgi:hypothetical protein
MRKFFSRKFFFLFHSSDEWFFMPAIFLFSRTYIVSCVYHIHTQSVLTTVNIYSFFSSPFFSPPIEKLFSFLYIFSFFSFYRPLNFIFILDFFCCFHFGFPLHDYFSFIISTFSIESKKKKRKTKNFLWFWYDS